MIDKALLRQTVENSIKDTDLFVVDITVSPQNNIVVEIDSDSEGIDIDTCARITRDIEARFDREVEDYELEVGSAGLTAPFKVARQYRKNIGNEVDILTRDGRKIHATLVAVGDNDFTFEYAVKRKEPGAKRPVTVMEQETIPFNMAKQVTYHISFK